jgi:hypothetical protein
VIWAPSSSLGSDLGPLELQTGSLTPRQRRYRDLDVTVIYFERGKPPMACQHTVQRDLEALGLPLRIGALSALCADRQGWRAMLYSFTLWRNAAKYS